MNNFCKKILLVFLFLVLTIISSCSNHELSEEAQTYYLYENGTYNKDIYIILDNDIWVDDDNASGEYSISGENIVFYIEIFGSKEELYTGTINAGVMVLDFFGVVSCYCLEGVKPI